MDESHFSQLCVCEDRLSELPDSLIFVIFSFLSMRDVVPTMLLSKRWKHLWATIPYLHFCSDSIDFRYPNFVSGALAQWEGAKILKFSLVLPIFQEIAPSDIDSWMQFAMEKQVEELSIDLAGWTISSGWGSEYCAPQHLYSCSSITKLSLSHCSLEIEENVQWNQLKGLTIEGKKSVGEDAMSKLLSGAPQLEEMILIFEVVSENLIIRSSSLKMLKIRRQGLLVETELDALVRIWAPNLLTLQLSSLICRDFMLDVPSLANAILYFHEWTYVNIIGSVSWHFPFQMFEKVLQSIRHVEKLTLSEPCIEVLVYMKNEDMFVPLSNVKILKLYASEAEDILDILEIFPNLKMLIVNQSDESRSISSGVDNKVDECYSLASWIVLLKPSLLLLKTVEISWSIRDASMIQAIEFLLENADMLEKMVLRLRMEGANPEAVIFAEEKVLSMRRSSPSAQVIINYEQNLMKLDVAF